MIRLDKSGCDACLRPSTLGFDFTMAFQPIVDVRDQTVFAYEALVRGIEGEGAPSILKKVNANNRYAFDQACRMRAIEIATTLGMKSKLSINFLPNAVYRPEACIRMTLATAKRCGFPLSNIMFELTEDERSNDIPHLSEIFGEYKRHGFIIAVDDFGAGYAGLELLASFQPDVIKIDMGLVRAIDQVRVKRVIVEGVVSICRQLGIEIIGEGIETSGELQVLVDMGINLFQGYFFAKPSVASLPTVHWNVG